MVNLATLLESTATAYPDRTAVVSGDVRLSYAEVDAAANQVANLLSSRGVLPGDAVALSMPNVPAFPVVYFGILKAGASVVPLNVLLKAREVAYHLEDARATAYIAHEGTPDLPIGDAAMEGFEAVSGCTTLVMAPGDPSQDPMWQDQPTDFATVERDDEDTAVILYTSGTTGQPKGAELRHRNLRDNALVCEQLFEVSAERPDTFLCALPLFHAFGQTCIQNCAFAFGASIVMMPRFVAESALQLMVREEVTVLAGVPTMYWALLAETEQDETTAGLAQHLRVAISGGAALPAEIHQRFRERFDVTILEGYGLSETSPTASFARYGESPRVGSIGVPIPGVEMRLVTDDWSDVPETPEAVGEIVIKGHNVMKGYRNRPDATAEAIRDGWFRSGDLARKDDDGFFYIVDRVKDVIIRGGFNVYPREIEELLIQHPAVSLVAVTGVPHPSHGEEVKAFVVRARGHEGIDDEELIDWTKERLAAYKYPRTIEFVTQMPTTSTGKILKRML